MEAAVRITWPCGVCGAHAECMTVTAARTTYTCRCTTARKANGRLFPQVGSGIGDEEVACTGGRLLRPGTPTHSAARAAPSNVLAWPTCRYLNDNSLSGTLPKEWSAMTSLTLL
jgi:hypothetical protein